MTTDIEKLAEDLIEQWGNELDSKGEPRLVGMAPGFRKGFKAGYQAALDQRIVLPQREVRVTLGGNIEVVDSPAGEQILKLERENERLRGELEEICKEYSGLFWSLKGTQSREYTLKEALESCRGQWIHSVNKRKCLAALKPYEALAPSEKEGRDE